MIIALFAIALPLLLQTTSRIDDKYSSTKLTEVFYSDRICKILIVTQIITLISVLTWIYRQPRNMNLGFLNILIDHSAFIFIAISTLFLVIWLFVFVYIITLFFNPNKLLEYLIKKHDRISIRFKILQYITQRVNKPNLLYKFASHLMQKHFEANLLKKKQYFLAISDILYFSIQKANESLARRLLDFLMVLFYSARINKENQVIIYPREYYDTFFEANEQLCLRKKKTISYFNDSTLLELLIDSNQSTILSEDTYTAIWVCLRQALEYQREDVVISYWCSAHQHFNFYMQPIYRVYDDDGKIINLKTFQTREKERERFLEFHYALGGLLLYLKKATLLKQIMSYTNQTPPKYLLVPETLTEVIKRYMTIKEDLYNPFQFENRYNFPNISGVNKSGIIKKWIRKYYALLFLRQYMLQDYTYGKSALKLPNIPNSLVEISEWTKELEYLKDDINKLLSESELLKEVGFGILSNNWFEDNNKENPEKILDDLIQETTNEYNRIKETQVISKTKKEEFAEQTKAIILNAINSYLIFENPSASNETTKSFTIYGIYQLMDKAGFADRQEISYLNSDSVVAQSVAANIHFIFSSTFSHFIKERYLLNSQDIFPAINKLGINADEYYIISFGIMLPFYYESLKTPKLTKVDNTYFYDNIEIINFNTYIHDSVRNSLIIIRKSNLPTIKFNETDKSEKVKYELEEIDEKTHLLYSIIDLNTRKDLTDEISKKGNSNTSKNVLACIALNMEVIWNINSESILIKPFEQFIDRGNPKTLNEVKGL